MTQVFLPNATKLAKRPDLYLHRNTRRIGGINAGRVFPMVWQPQLGVVLDLSQPSWSKKDCDRLPHSSFADGLALTRQCRTLTIDDLDQAPTGMGSGGAKPLTEKAGISALPDFPPGSIEEKFLMREQAKALDLQFARVHADNGQLQAQRDGLEAAIGTLKLQLANTRKELEVERAKSDGYMKMIAADKGLAEALRLRDHWKRQYDDAERKKRSTQEIVDKRDQTIRQQESDIRKAENDRDEKARQLSESNRRLAEAELKSSPIVQQRDLRKLSAQQRLIAGLLPRLTLDEESWETIHAYCQNPTGLVRVLQQLSLKEKTLASHALPNTAWRELAEHIASGVDSRLRVYWKREAEENIRVRVYYKVSDEDQDLLHKQFRQK